MSLLMADARAIPLADGTVQCVVTSPPYWGLRDYGTATWAGGDLACDHRMKNPEVDQRTSTLGHNRAGLDISNAAYQHGKAFRDVCGKCGARRIDQQIGLEQTPDAYVAELVAVFREVRRVLRDDGVLWLNLGDSYARDAGTEKAQSVAMANPYDMRPHGRRDRLAGSCLKPKDLVGIPWRVAFALQADGWYLRSDIIWAKPNPMPESVTDRPTKAHEYVFLLTKSERYTYHAIAGVRHARTVWTIATQPYSGAHFATFPEALVERCVLAGSRVGERVFDPFGGSGTVARVALSLGRKAVCTELNPAYLALADERTHVTLGLPLEFEGMTA